jgi:hypothetical protein
MFEKSNLTIDLLVTEVKTHVNRIGFGGVAGI